MPNAVGLIGIGLMGTALARRLLAAGFEVVGFDMDPAKRRALEDMGGRPVESVLEVGRACSLVLVAVLTTNQVEQVVEGPDGLLAAPPPAQGRVALCFATCDPERIAALARRCAPLGLALLDTPVSGTSEQVLRGDGLGL